MGLRKAYSDDDIKQIYQLHLEGLSNVEIAARVRPGVKTANIVIGQILKKYRLENARNTAELAMGAAPTDYKRNIAAKPVVPPAAILPKNLEGSLSAREYMTMLDPDQRDLFISTYEDLRGEADDEQLTRAENEMLMRAAFSHVKYIRAQFMLAMSEKYLMKELNGELSDSDEDNAKKRLAGRGDAYKKEAEQWHKEYMELLNDLKLTRKQRLEKIKDTRNTFLDLQQELMTRSRQISVIEDIKKINMATKDELLRIAKGEVGPDNKPHPWLIGAFEEITDND